MLIEMNVTNFRSLRGTQSFSLVKGKGDELLESNVFNAQSANEFELLRSAAIYGPNASGKSNFLMALQVMKRIVLESATSLQHGDPLPVKPFLLASESRDEPSEFEAIFLADGVRYQYGFSASSTQIHSEWLFAYPKGVPQSWIARRWLPNEQRIEWGADSKLKGAKQLWKNSTRNNALFLSTAVQLNSVQLKPVFDWFSKTLKLSNVGGWDATITAYMCEMEGKSKVIEFLQAADLDIQDVSIEKRAFDPNDLPGPFKRAVSENLKGQKSLDIKSVYTDNDGKPVVFDFDNESHGTKTLFLFAGPWIDSLENGYVLFIDELHDSLHPNLVRFLVEHFNNSKTNPKNAQLVFTTHETSILNQEVFRRDQIWFCEKDERSATELYPLTDISPRKGRENLELAYLSGCYGALPFVKKLRSVG